MFDAGLKHTHTNTQTHTHLIVIGTRRMKGYYVYIHGMQLSNGGDCFPQLGISDSRGTLLGLTIGNAFEIIDLFTRPVCTCMHVVHKPCKSLPRSGAAQVPNEEQVLGR